MYLFLTVNIILSKLARLYNLSDYHSAFTWQHLNPLLLDSIFLKFVLLIWLCQQLLFMSNDIKKKTIKEKKIQLPFDVRAFEPRAILNRRQASALDLNGNAEGPGFIKK